MNHSVNSSRLIKPSRIGTRRNKTGLVKNVRPRQAYLEPSQTSTMELFCENSQRLKAVNYFPKKSGIVDV